MVRLLKTHFMQPFCRNDLVAIQQKLKTFQGNWPNLLQKVPDNDFTLDRRNLLQQKLVFSKASGCEPTICR